MISSGRPRSTASRSNTCVTRRPWQRYVHFCGKALPGEIIDHGQHSDPLAIGEGVGHEVHRPSPVWALQCRRGGCRVTAGHSVCAAAARTATLPGRAGRPVLRFTPNPFRRSNTHNRRYPKRRRSAAREQSRSRSLLMRSRLFRLALTDNTSGTMAELLEVVCGSWQKLPLTGQESWKRAVAHFRRLARAVLSKPCGEDVSIVHVARSPVE